MRKNVPLLFTGVMILILLVVTACAPRTTQPPQAELVEESPSTEEEIEDMGENDEGQQPEEQPAVDESGGPADVPIMDGAYRLQTARAGTSISYQVDGSIEDVVAFYQEELEKLGWQATGTGDALIGPRATLVREKEDARMSINLQYNSVGDFVVINIYFVDR